MSSGVHFGKVFSFIGYTQTQMNRRKYNVSRHLSYVISRTFDHVDYITSNTKLSPF